MEPVSWYNEGAGIWTSLVRIVQVRGEICRATGAEETSDHTVGEIHSKVYACSWAWAPGVYVNLETPQTNCYCSPDSVQNVEGNP